LARSRVLIALISLTMASFLLHLFQAAEDRSEPFAVVIAISGCWERRQATILNVQKVHVGMPLFVLGFPCINPTQ
jgi:hypothetical protein